MELHLAGAFRVVRDSIELTDGQVGSRKSRTLLKLLAVERPGLVPVDRIVAILWPDGQPAAPERNVAILVSRLRAALGPDLIQGGRAGYRLAAPNAVVDLDEAASFCAQAEGKLEHAAAVALAAAASGEPARALAVYEALRQRLGTELGAHPAPPTRELHVAILRERGGSTGPAAARTARDGPGSPAGPIPPAGPVPPVPPAPLTSLAGRDQEIGELREAWHQAAGGQPALVIFTGEAGIGSSSPTPLTTRRAT